MKIENAEIAATYVHSSGVVRQRVVRKNEHAMAKIRLPYCKPLQTLRSLPQSCDFDATGS